MTTDTIGPAATEARAAVGLPRQVVRFGLIGVASTVLNLALFAALDQVMARQPANLAALVVCTVLNTAANRFFTFGVRGRAGAARVQLQSLGLLAITWAATAFALLVLHRVAPSASTLWATATVAAGNAVATIVRFVLLRRWLSA